MANLKKLTLLHSNDMHGDFLAEKVDENLLGGVSMLSGYVNKVRNEEPNTVYAISGDMFRGSVIDSEFKGLSTIEIMNMLGPDVVTIGNHEVDYGVAHLLFIEKCARFPIINANFFVRINHTRLFKPCQLIEIGGMKILFIGVITQEVLSQTKQDALIGSFVDVFEAAQEVGRICNAHNALDIDFTVLLTHIGFEEDKRLAAMLDPAWGVDVIIGGHSHTLPDEPAVVNGIPIVQAGTGTDAIGRFDIMVDTDKNCIDSYEWRLVPITPANCPRDTELEKLIQGYKSQTDDKYGRLITRFKRQLTHPERTRETEVGNLFADILKESFAVDVMLVGSGSMRAETMGPIVSFGDLTEMYPYDDAIHMIKLTGAQFKRMVKHILREDNFNGHGEFYQFSKGVHIRYSRKTGELIELTLNGEPIDDERLYSVGLQDFHYGSMEKFLSITLDEVKQNAKPRVICTSCREVLEEYMTENQHLCREVEGRLVVEQ